MTRLQANLCRLQSAAGHSLEQYLYFDRFHFEQVLNSDASSGCFWQLEQKIKVELNCQETQPIKRSTDCPGVFQIKI